MHVLFAFATVHITGDLRQASGEGEVDESRVFVDADGIYTPLLFPS